MITLATCNSALDGIQPTFKHTPPNVACFSTNTVCKPKSAALNAAVYPPGPAPKTITSQTISPSLAAGAADACGATNGAAGAGVAAAA